MLVLSRREGEQLMIGSEVVLTVLEVRGNRARLGIEASPGISVLRHELYRNRLEGSLPLARPAHATTA